MKDLLEHLEAGAEARLEQMTDGLPEGKFRCGCGKVTDFNDAHSSSESPYSMPICGECLDSMIGE
jgi:hypothetical protein